MTYEERQRFRERRLELEALRARLEEGDPAAPISRREALEILSLLDWVAGRVSPERWDRALEALAEEAARRADVLTARRG